MTYLERTFTGMLVVTIAVFGWYFLDIALNMPIDQTSVSDFAPRMWLMMGLYIVLVIIIAVANCVWQKEPVEDMDERDRIIDMRAEWLASHTQSWAIFGVLALVLFDFSVFIIAHALLATIVISTIVSIARRLHLYRRGV